MGTAGGVEPVVSRFTEGRLNESGARRYDQGMRRREFVTAASLGAVATLIPRTSFAGSWKLVSRESGITVSTRIEGDRQYPTFRGTGRVKAGIADIVAVIQDASRHTQWLHECSDAAELKVVNDNTRIVYNRVDAPWPVSDRDVVLRGTMDIISSKEVRIRFRAIKTGLKKPVAGVVRMPILDGHWYLVAANETATLVEYQVNADPGGKLPAALVETSSKDLPLHTIKNLRRQVAKTQGAGTYDKLIGDYMAKLRAKAIP